MVMHHQHHYSHRLRCSAVYRDRKATLRPKGPKI